MTYLKVYLIQTTQRCSGWLYSDILIMGFLHRILTGSLLFSNIKNHNDDSDTQFGVSEMLGLYARL